MREKYIFLIGLGTGLVITSIFSLFLYNITKDDNPSTYNQEITEESSNIITEFTTENISQGVSNTTQATTKMELQTDKPFELTTDKPFNITTKQQN